MFSLEDTIVYLMTVTATAFIMGWALPFGIEKIGDYFKLIITYFLFYS